jgi:Flp pilus assembly protein TadG
MRSNRRRRQRGVALILVTIGALALIAMAGLALDMGVAYIAKSRLQNALDAGALAGANVLNTEYNTGAAEAAALAEFAANMGSLTASATVTMSPTLTPFSAGGANPRFLRIAVASMTTPLRLVRVLPGLGATFTLGGSAVAGPIPVGGEICNAIPVALCATDIADTNCNDGACFGYPTGTEIVFRDPDNTGLSSGNFGLVEFPGFSTGSGASLRRGMAGGYDFCFDIGSSVSPATGVNAGPVAQGMNTRFNQYGAGLSASQYPPDLVITSNITYSAYRARLAAGPPYDVSQAIGRPQRRVVVLPAVDCSTTVPNNGSTQVIAGACFFLTQPMNQSQKEIRGELIPSCKISGNVPEDPDPTTGLFKIVLYRDPLSNQS